MRGARLMPAEPWVSVEQLASHLRVASDSVHRRVDGRALPSHTIGRLCNLGLSAVYAWVRAGDAEDRANGGAGKSVR